MIAITKVKQNLSVIVIREGKTMTQILSPGSKGYTERVLSSHMRLKELGLIDLVEVDDSVVPELVKDNEVIDSAPVEDNSPVQVTINRKRRKKE